MTLLLIKHIRKHFTELYLKLAFLMSKYLISSYVFYTCWIENCHSFRSISFGFLVISVLKKTLQYITFLSIYWTRLSKYLADLVKRSDNQFWSQLLNEKDCTSSAWISVKHAILSVLLGKFEVSRKRNIFERSCVIL